ncbi:hypothetical protein LCGC14_0405300 [marine sediment metagenome]|uniref:Uncharacterized protein n=1 Tax=marine sediment metagenome TaxID=412755 RepID=A0A0F9VHI0_9ZZZZ
MNNYTQNTCLTPYSKVKNNTYEHLSSKNTSPKSRLAYSFLGSRLDYDSSNSRATYDQILKGCGFGSYQTVSRCLSELTDKGLIVRVGRSRYRLTYGIYMGIIENENKTEKTIPSSPSQKKANTTPSVVKVNPPIYSIILNNNKLRKSRHDRFPNVGETIKPDDVSNFKFKKDSPFSKMPKSTLYKMIKRYGVTMVQDRITRLEGCYTLDKIRTTPAALLYGALTDNGEWKYKTKKGEVINLRYPTNEKTQQMLRDDRAIKKLNDGTKIKMDVFKKTNPVLIEKFHLKIQEETPRSMNIPFLYEIAMNAKISEYIGGVR